jgi:phospholipase C
MKDVQARYDFVLARGLDTDAYSLWRVDYSTEELLLRVPLADDAKFDRTHQMAPIGRYLLEWGPMMLKEYEPCFPYRLLEFDPTSKHPLAGKAVKSGLWSKQKFWGARPDFGNPEGANEGFDSGDALLLVPLGGFVLNVIPTEGRGTFKLWNFDPNLHNVDLNALSADSFNAHSSDPLPQTYSYGTPQGSFDTIDYGHELIGMGNYVLDRKPETGEYWVWSFDPKSAMPLGQPAIQSGRWEDIEPHHQFVALGDRLLDWVPSDGRYRLWEFDPKSTNPLRGPIRHGRLPAAFDVNTTLTGIQPILPINPAFKSTPGTIDFMRDKIKHVVYLMLENRSFDHVCGWLYEKGEKGVNFVGRDGPFDGASLDMFNVDPGARGGPRKVYLSKYNDGKLSDDVELDFLAQDPYHDKADVMRQFFFNQPDGYAKRETPGMGGFVWNNGVHQVMWTYTPEQLPVLNGLAKEFAVSDAWFCPMPSCTDPNRAFAFTGSAVGELNNFQNGPQYQLWPTAPHRSSIWKTLWTNGFDDWRFYNSVIWMKFVHTYHLFLEGQIPSVDAAIAKDPTSFIASVEQFKKDALAGKLPRFSYLEPVWIGGPGTTSYHPGADPVLGERALNELYEAMKNGPAWNQTLFVITFDEHGGLFDHAPPPYAVNPWPNDVNDGFRYDMMGVRVPGILVSPLIEQHTVFRSPTPVAYDSTSILATLLNWYGIPKARWGLGDRVDHAPTFENVIQRAEPRVDAPTFTPPYDKSFPRSGDEKPKPRISDLDLLMAPRVVAALGAGKLSHAEIHAASHDVLRSRDMGTLHGKLKKLAEQVD